MKKIDDTDHNRKTFMKSLRYLIDNSPYDAKSIAALLDVKLSTFYGWANGSNFPRMESLQMLADFFHVSVSDMLDGKVMEERPVQKEDVPVRGEASGILALPGSSMSASFCIVMPDNSMEDIGINEGDVLFISEGTPVRNGEIAFVSVAEKDLVRKVYSFPAHKILLLIPESSAFEETLLSGEAIKKARIVGKVIAVQKAL